METETESSNHHQGSFGAGFIVGAIFALFAFFFLATKKGRQLAKRIDFSDFDLAKLDQILSEFSDSQNVRQEIKNFANENIQSNGVVSENNSQRTSKIHPPTLGRRFFHRRK